MAVPKVLEHTLYLFLTALVCFLVALLGEYYVWQNVDVSNVTPLEDFMFKYLPDFSDHFADYPVPNWVFTAMIIVALISFPYEYIFKYSAQYLFLQSLLTGARGLIVGLTLLPLTLHNEACSHIPSTYFEAFGNTLKYGSCGDFMWSGHTASAFLLYLFVANHHRFYPMQVIQGLLLGGMFLSLLVFHWHYTLDIVMALIVTYLFFHVYKQYENIKQYWFYFEEFRLNKGQNRRDDFNVTYKPARSKSADLEW